MNAMRLMQRMIGLCVGLGCFLTLAHADDPPNILLLIGDDIGVGNVGAYTTGPNANPGDPPPTPNIDALAADGVLFRAAWATPVCSTTRACLYTGRYGFRTGIRNVLERGDPGLPLAEEILPEVLATGGYASGLFGKWDLGDEIELGGRDAPRVAGWSYHAGILVGGLSDYFSWSKVVNGAFPVTVDNYATTENVDDALAWVGNQTGPWFCTLAFNAPHTPFHVPPTDLITLTPVGPNNTRRYKAMIEAMDTEIGRLIAGLGAGLDNTVIIFIGDNGTPIQVLESPYTTGKGSIYEGGVLVPLIITGPGIEGAGREVLGPVACVDLFATIADFAGVGVAGVSAPLDAVSLQPILSDPNTAHPRTTMYAELVTDTAVNGAYAIRDSQYKLIQQAGQFEFYDLTADPYEATDLLQAAGGLSPTEQAAYDALYAELFDLRSALCTADVNRDGGVDYGDYATQEASLGTSAASGDVDNDDDSDIADVAVTMQEMGQNCW